MSGDPIEIPVDGISDGPIRLRLRTDADMPATVAACQDPDIARWTRVPDSYDEATAAEWAEESRRQRESGEGISSSRMPRETTCSGRSEFG